MVPLTWATTLVSYFIGRVFDDTVNFMVPFSIAPREQISFLGLGYDSNGTDNATFRFIDDFQSRIFLPYRNGFDPIIIPGKYNATNLISDQGWGCAIRSTQMLVAQSISNIRLGRDFRLSSATSAQEEILREIVWMFRDVPDGELSIHRIVGFGAERLDKVPGTWFGPSSAGVSIPNLWHQSNQIGVVYTGGDQVAIHEIQDALASHPDGIIILVSLRIGLDTIDLPQYKNHLIRLFQYHLFQGMVGGDGMRAFYIPAVSDWYLYYLDPHVVYPAIKDLETLPERMVSMRAPFRMRWERLDPQISLAFTVTSQAEADELYAFMRSSILFNMVDFWPLEPVWTDDYSSDGGEETTANRTGTTYV